MASTPDGSIVVVGAPNATVTNGGSFSDAGAVYVFTEPAGGWGSGTLAPDVLTVSSPATGANLGASVAISADGSTIVAGAPGQGAAYVFNEPTGEWSGQTTYSQDNELTGPSAAQFGASVAVYGSSNSSAGANILVGAPGFNSNAGAVYVFSYSLNSTTPLSTTSTLTASSPTTNDSFGSSVGIDSSDGTAIIVGAPGYLSGEGAVYFFTFVPATTAGTPGTSSYLVQFADPGNTPGDQFGTSVAISGTTTLGTTAVVGAPGLNTGLGAAYVFNAPTGSWGQEAELTASSPTAGSQLGTSVAISSDASRILAGSLPVGSAGNYSPGTLYQFNETSHGPNDYWTNENESADFQDSTLSSQTADDGFASSTAVGISGRTTWLFGDAPNAGTAYVFQGK